MSNQRRASDKQPSETGAPVNPKPNNPPEPPPVVGNPGQKPDFVHGNNPTPK
jgi:hypothetical protein